MFMFSEGCRPWRSPTPTPPVDIILAVGAFLEFAVVMAVLGQGFVPMQGRTELC